jgi:membrane protease YdiL (CAAX protease family)
MPVFWTYLAVVVGCAIVSVFLFGEKRFNWEGYFILSEFAIFVTTAVVAGIYWRSLVPQLKTLGLTRWETLAAVAALGPLLMVNYYYHNWAIDSLGAERTRPINPLSEAEYGKATLVFLVCVLPALLEEIAFRGLVQHWMQVAVKPLKAIVYASALFTVLHFSVVSAPYILAVGALLGWVKWRTRSLYGPMLIHFLHNFVVLEFF